MESKIEKYKTTHDSDSQHCDCSENVVGFSRGECASEIQTLQRTVDAYKDLAQRQGSVIELLNELLVEANTVIIEAQAAVKPVANHITDGNSLIVSPANTMGAGLASLIETVEQYEKEYRRGLSAVQGKLA